MLHRSPQHAQLSCIIQRMHEDRMETSESFPTILLPSPTRFVSTVNLYGEVYSSLNDMQCADEERERIIHMCGEKTSSSMTGVPRVTALADCQFTNKIHSMTTTYRNTYLDAENKINNNHGTVNVPIPQPSTVTPIISTSTSVSPLNVRSSTPPASFTNRFTNNNSQNVPVSTYHSTLNELAQQIAIKMVATGSVDAGQQSMSSSASGQLKSMNTQNIYQSNHPQVVRPVPQQFQSYQSQSSLNQNHQFSSNNIPQTSSSGRSMQQYQHRSQPIMNGDQSSAYSRPSQYSSHTMQQPKEVSPRPTKRKSNSGPIAHRSTFGISNHKDRFG